MLRVLLLLILSGPAVAWGKSVRVVAPVQADFAAVAEDMTGALSFKPLNPSEPLGLVGFHVGGALSYTELENRGAWRRLTGSGFSEFAVAGVRAGKGLPFGLDVGGFYAEVLDSNVELWGAELRYAIAEGGLVSPALGLRLAYSESLGIDDFDFSTASIDLSVSKGFAIATPYAGVGRVWGRAEPGSGVPLSTEEPSNNKFYAGVRLNLVLVVLVLEADNTGRNTSFNLRAGIGF